MKILKIKSFNSVGFVFLVGLVIAMSFPGYVLACRAELSNAPSLSPAAMNLSYRQTDTDSASKVLGGWSNVIQPTYRLIGCSSEHTLEFSAKSTKAPLASRVLDNGTSYAVYPTETPNIGYYISVQDQSASHTVLGEGSYTGLALRGGSSINIWIRFVATGPLSPGFYDLSARDVVRLRWTVAAVDPRANRHPSGMVGGIISQGTSTISYSAAGVTVTGSTCTVNAADQNQTVVLPTVSSSSFQRIGSTAGSQRFTMGVNCPAGIALHATMTDANTPASRLNFLMLAPDSTAAGIGLQITATDTANVVSYGADSRVAGNNNQWFIGGNATSPATNYRIPFTVRYVQTAATVRPGTVHARSTITFSYQ